MRTYFTSIFIAATVVASCQLFTPERPEESKSALVISFSDFDYSLTRASSEIPDTCDFLLKVYDAGGKVIYDGKFGDSPETLLVSKGTYNVSVRSASQKLPAFSSPVYGDDQCVVVAAGAVVNVKMQCQQQNCGVKLRIDRSFLSNCPDGVLFLQSTDGKLMYSYSEKRVAYFNPGKISVILSEGTAQRTLLTRTLQAKDMLSLGISASSSSAQEQASGISLQIDTSRNWLSESYVIGGSGSGSGGGSEGSAMNVATARSAAPMDDVWVYGYIVGVFKSVSFIQTEPPFSSATNIIIAGRSAFSSKESCLSIELKKGDLRDELNLLDNPELLGSKVFLQGDLVESYYGIPGLKNITDWSLD